LQWTNDRKEYYRKESEHFRKSREFDIMYKKEISSAGALLDVALEKQIIEKRSSWLNYKGTPLVFWIAHPIASFQFADSLPLAISIETRKAVGQSYSALRGFYRQYELIYIPADERDVIRLCTNYRGEEVYLYHITVSAERARAIFLEYLQRLNELHERAEFYNAVTDNCTTNIRAANIAAEHGKVPPWNWRVLLNGKMDGIITLRARLYRSQRAIGRA
jgi:hypothetical protein